MKDLLVKDLISLRQQVTELERERKQVKESPQQSKDLFQSLTEIIFDNIVIVDSDGNTSYISPSIKQMLGYEPEELIGKAALDLIHPDDLQNRNSGFTELLQVQNDVVSIELRIKHKDGSWRNIECRGKNLLGNPSIAGIVISMQDITKPEQLKNDYRQLLEDIKDGYAVLQDGIIVFANKSFSEIFGYEPGQVKGCNIINVIAPDSLKETLDLYARVINGMEEPPEEIELMGIKREGTKFPIQGSIKQIEYKGKTAYSAVVRDITERKQAEEALEKNREYFQTIIENSFDIVAIVNSIGIVQNVSPSVKWMLGYDPEEWVGRAPFDLIHPDDLPKLLSTFDEILKAPKNVVTIELRIKHRDNSWRIIECISKNLLDHPSVTGIVINFRDITDYRRQDKNYKGLIDDLNDGYAVYQAEGIVLANRRFVEIYGYTMDQVLGKDFLTFIAPEDREKIADIYTKAMSDADETPERIEFAGIKSDGTIITVETSIKIIDYEGKPAFGVIFRDITENQQVKKALEERKEYYQALIESAYDCIAVIEETGNITYISPSIKQIVGYEPEEIINEGNLFKDIHPDDLEKATNNFTEAMTIPGKSISTELRIKHKDGSWRHIEGTGTNLMDNPAVSGLIINLRDISDYREKDKNYKELIEDINDGYLVFQDGSIVLANQKFAEIFGYTTEQVLGNDFLRLLAPESHQEIIGKYINTLSGRGKSQERIEVTGIKNNGAKITVEASIKTIEYEGKPAFSVIVTDITERNQATEEIKHGREYFQALIENAYDAVVILDDNGCATYVSPSIKNMFGYKPEEIEDWGNLLSRTHPEDIQKVAENFAEVIATPGKSLSIELRIEHKDGSWRYIEATGTNLLKHPSISGVICNIRDVTEYKQTKDIIEKNREYFQSLIENAYDAIIILDNTGAASYISPSIKQTLGYEPQEIIGSGNLFNLAHPEDIQKLAENFAEGLDISGKTVTMELRIKHKDGSWRHIEGTGTNLLDHPSIEGFVCNLRDVTARKQAEDTFRQLLGEINDGYAIYQDDTIVLANSSLANMLGYTIDEMVGKQFSTFIAPASIKHTTMEYRRVTETEGEAKDRYEIAVNKKDGTEVVLDISVKAIEYEGKPAISCTLRDTTEQKRAQEELETLYIGEKKLREELEEEKERKAEFTRVLVHELKTPLTSVMSSSEALMDVLTHKTYKRLANNINRGAINLSNRVDDLLDLAKGDIGKLQLNFEPVDLLLLIRRVAEYMDPVARSYDHSLILDLPQSLPLPQADETRLQQIMLNLLNNASKFTPSGGKITIRARTKDSALIVEVQDTGTGINEEQRQRLFEPYYRVENDRQILNGLGLGLALCKTLVELHGGQIWVESRLGEGSTFGFSLPIEDTSEDA